MVKIRLKRIGAKKKPYYRVVVADSRAPRNGRFIEEIGTYDPMADPTKFDVDMEKVREWVGKGAQMTDTVMHLVKKNGEMDKPEVEAEEAKTQEGEDIVKAEGETEDVKPEKEGDGDEKAGSETTKTDETDGSEEEKEDAAEGDSK